MTEKKTIKAVPKPAQKANNNKKTANNRNKRVKKLEVMIPVNPRKIITGLLLAFFGLSFFYSLVSPPVVGEEIALSSALKDIKESKVENVLIEGEKIILTYKEGDEEVIKISRKEGGESFTEVLKNADIDPTSVEYQTKDLSMSRAWAEIIGTILPIVVTAGVLIFLFRQARGAQDSLFSFGRSKARLFSKGKQNISFKDVAGVDEAKKELEEIIDFLKHPKKYLKMGARTPKGVLLIGPSGCGKTLLAKAVAGEAGVPFFSMAGSEFMEMLVGVGSARMRDLFQTAKKSTPSIIFIDEIDAIGRQRGLGVAGGHDEREQTLNQMLVEMDGFNPNDQVVVMAASVAGDTPILIKKDQEIKLLSIGEFVDQYYDNKQEEGEKNVKDIQTLGFDRKVGKGNFNKRNLYFSNSAFKKACSVFKHRVDHIYKIDFIGGTIKATGNHSVFVRTPKGIETKAVSQLKTGDILVDLPYKANRTTKKFREIRAHKFPKDWSLSLSVYQEDLDWQEKHLYALKNPDNLSQQKIGEAIGVEQTTVSLWQRGINPPRALSRKYYKHQLPEQVKVTPELMRLFGYYAAEGYARKEVDFCFGVTESAMIKDLIYLTNKIFGLEPDTIRHITPGAVNIIYYSKPLADIFKAHCGAGAKNKHVPSFLFEAPFEYFQEFLRGLFRGDGYKDKRGRYEITSVSKQLVLQLNWLASMHGVKTFINSFVAKGGRRIGNGKPLKETIAYRLRWGKMADPLSDVNRDRAAWCRPIVKSVKKVSYNGFVYDLCGCENEAFFGGQRPILLHNTNRPDILDPALTRPGRFDRRILVDMPDIDDRKAILKVHMKGKPFVSDVDWDKIARRTVSFSGADLENMLNEAAILAAREDKKAINMDDLEEAATKVKLGPEKRRKQTEQARKMTAYHEAGHAVVAFYTKASDPVHRISIVSRGMSLGYTMIPPKTDKYTETRTELLAKIRTMLGGRAAEKLIFKELTGGAASDIDQATRIARTMVVDFGMSELGPIKYSPQMETTEYGRLWFEPSRLSDRMQSKVDDEIKKIVDEQFDKALQTLERHKEKLDIISAKLVEQETIEGNEFKALMES